MAKSEARSSAEENAKDGKGAKKVAVFLGFVACFFAGVHFGGGAYLAKQGYGNGDTDPIQDFVDRRLLPALEETYTSLMEKESNASASSTDETSLRPGEKFKRELVASGKRAAPKHPVLFVPGFITGGLQLWSGEECLNRHFRESIWGGNGMARAFLADKECWMRHLSLDPLTGMDPAGGDIKIRAQAGFEAADYFISSYWILGKIIQSLADVGYDPNSMDMLTYDWRMAYPLIEERDGFLTDFKLKVERHVQKTGEKAVLIGHSMGNIVILFFLRWVTEPKEAGGGGGGTDWVEKHIEAFVNVAGPLLGVPKAMSAILSGEMKETALLGKMGELLEMYIGAKRRKDLIATWASVWAMLPKGGPAMWEIGADVAGEGEDMRLLQPSPNCNRSAEVSSTSSDGTCPDGGDVCANPDSGSTSSSTKNDVDATIKAFDKIHETGTLDDAIQFMLDWGGGVGQKVAASRYHSFRSSNKGEFPAVAQWHNPIATPLPIAPSMKVYCLYGVGVETERGYVYKRNVDENSTKFLDPPFLIDSAFSDPKRKIEYGVMVSDGDGSVPLLSLGYMCADGWVDNEKLNPSKLDVITREYKHEAAFQMHDPLRAGPKAGEHCDLLGNHDLILDILKIATGAGGVETRIVSDVKDMAAKINAHSLGGLDYVSNVEPRYKPGPLPAE